MKNKDIRSAVEAMEPFKNSVGSLFGEWHTQFVGPATQPATTVARYCVYSYRYDWPLFVAERTEEGEWQWYENVTRFSVTTSKHVGLARPGGINRPILPVSVGSLRRIATHGIAGLAAMGEIAGD